MIADPRFPIAALHGKIYVLNGCRYYGYTDRVTGRLEMRLCPQKHSKKQLAYYKRFRQHFKKGQFGYVPNPPHIPAADLEPTLSRP